jgi:hypothetical protein
MNAKRYIIVTAGVLLLAGVLLVSIAVASHTSGDSTAGADQGWSDSGVHIRLAERSSSPGVGYMVLAPASYLSSDTSTDWSDVGAQPHSAGSATQFMVLAPASYLSSDTSTDWSDVGVHLLTETRVGGWNDAGAARFAPYRADIWNDAGASLR